MFLLPALLSLAACSTTGPANPGPVVSPTGIVYDPGVPPVETRFSQTATLYLRSGESERALELAQEGIEADPSNPIHYFLAGTASARTERYAKADSLFDEAERLYPAYELGIEPERESAWAEAFSAGAEAYAEGNLSEAKVAWQGAVHIYHLRPEAHRNLAMLLSDDGSYDEAIEVYQAALEGLGRLPATRVLPAEQVEERTEARWRIEESLADLLLVQESFQDAEPLLRQQLERNPGSVQTRQNLAAARAGQGRRDEAAELYGALLSEGEMEPAQLFNLGVALFRNGEFVQAGEAFRRLTERRPHSRDPWFNYVNALFAAEDWASLTGAGDRLLELDPLNENAALVVARAHLELGDEAEAVRRLEIIDAAPIHLEGIVLQPSPGGSTLQGRMIGNSAEGGEPIRLRFTFYHEAEETGGETLLVETPAPGDVKTFEVPHATRATGYRYELLNQAP